ncbi:CYTH domain-containing protein [Oceanobacillus senegalensis]|uniref:CYTH domain-containing protein n=1 Tax=Oceanobacillus senegalensis TaxID=1936063 RepID=UPI000A30EB98|nr:CYTH domain-containing protein [Oceanobacillus senegalensis]
MAQEIEIEYKNLLTKEEFKHLLDKLPFPEYSVKQTNFYFETETLSLKDKGCALRIREKAAKYRLTLKEPHELGLLETHDELSKEEALQWTKGNIIPKPETTKQLTNLGIEPKDLIYFGKLITERREVTHRNCFIVLDYSIYNDKEDFEFELEASDRKTGIDTFHSLLEECNITIKNTPNKIERFFDSLPK